MAIPPRRVAPPALARRATPLFDYRGTPVDAKARDDRDSPRPGRGESESRLAAAPGITAMVRAPAGHGLGRLFLRGSPVLAGDVDHGAAPGGRRHPDPGREDRLGLVVAAVGP